VSDLRCRAHTRDVLYPSTTRCAGGPPPPPEEDFVAANGVSAVKVR